MTHSGNDASDEPRDDPSSSSAPPHAPPSPRRHPPHGTCVAMLAAHASQSGPGADQAAQRPSSSPASPDGVDLVRTRRTRLQGPSSPTTIVTTTAPRPPRRRPRRQPDERSVSNRRSGCQSNWCSVECADGGLGRFQTPLRRRVTLRFRLRTSPNCRRRPHCCQIAAVELTERPIPHWLMSPSAGRRTAVGNVRHPLRPPLRPVDVGGLDGSRSGLGAVARYRLSGWLPPTVRPRSSSRVDAGHRRSVRRRIGHGRSRRHLGRHPRVRTRRAPRPDEPNSSSLRNAASSQLSKALRYWAERCETGNDGGGRRSSTVRHTSAGIADGTGSKPFSIRSARSSAAR